MQFERTTFPSITLYSINGRYYPTDASRKANAIADAFVESFADLTPEEQEAKTDTIPCFNCTLADGHADMGNEVRTMDCGHKAIIGYNLAHLGMGNVEVCGLCEYQERQRR